MARPLLPQCLLVRLDLQDQHDICLSLMGSESHIKAGTLGGIGGVQRYRLQYCSIEATSGSAQTPVSADLIGSNLEGKPELAIVSGAFAGLVGVGLSWPLKPALLPVCAWRVRVVGGETSRLDLDRTPSSRTAPIYTSS